MPAADAVGTGSKAGVTGVLTVGYFVNDMVAKQTQGAASRTFTLDPRLDRVASVSDGTTTTVNHYSSGGDSPCWTSAGAGWARNVSGPDGALVGVQSSAGTVSLQLANLHGDVAATVNDDPAATAPSTQSVYLEFGQPKVPASGPDVCGWLGTHQRSVQPLAGLILMGVRLCNPTTARFLSTDPIPGGNANPYTYPTNPTSKFDLNGQCWSWASWACHAAHAVGHGVSVGAVPPGRREDGCEVDRHQQPQGSQGRRSGGDIRGKGIWLVGSGQGAPRLRWGCRVCGGHVHMVARQLGYPNAHRGVMLYRHSPITRPYIGRGADD